MKLESFEQAIDEYLQHLIDIKRSAYSIATAKAALAKVFGVEATQFIATPPRLRANVKRSRDEVKRDKHISKKRRSPGTFHECDRLA